MPPRLSFLIPSESLYFIESHCHGAKGGRPVSFINTIREDIKTVQAQDPAAQNGLVIFLSYPGLHAKWNHVPEHWLWEHGHRSLARVLSQITRHITGVEIHPAAQIGKHFFIDHAMGVVIGETTIVGDNCVLYQGVTLGGTGKEKGKRGKILSVNPKKGMVVIEGVNMIKCHTKPRRQGETGGIIEREGALRACKVMRVCPKCDKPTRVAHKITENGTKLTVCKHCGETL